MTTKQQIQVWAVLLVAFLLLLWVLRGVLLPFVAAAAVAYLFDPVADWLERRKLPRVVAVILITVTFLLIAAAVLIGVVPLLVQETKALAEALPGLMEQARANFDRLIDGRLNEILSRKDGMLGEMMGGVRESIISGLNAVTQQIWKSTAGLFNLIGLVTITPIVAFYLLVDWDKIITRIDHLLPRQHAPRIRMLAGQVDQVMAGYVRGIALVCFVLSIFYSVLLILVGLNYALVIGIISGALSFIPFLGSVAGFVIAGAVALLQFWEQPWHIALVLGVFVAGQVFEGNFITPRLMGDNVGLHPVWVLFAVVAFGALFGFVGVLLAVPIAATIGVLVRHFLGLYLESHLYHGGAAPLPVPAPDPPADRAP